MSGSIFSQSTFSPISLRSINEELNPSRSVQPTTQNSEESSGSSCEPSNCGISEDTVSGSLLRDYARHIDPIQLNDQMSGPEPTTDRKVDSPGKTTGSETQRYSTNSQTNSSFFPRGAPRSFLNHRKNAHSVDSVPHQTIKKALESKGAQGEGSSIPLSHSLVDMLHSTNETGAGPSVPTTQPCSYSGGLLDKTPSTARFPLKSPCFFHQRFDDAVNVEKVLEEISGDEWMSHSRLVQTATGVREVSRQLQRRPIKLAVRNVMIVTKARDHGLVYLTRELAEWLLSTPRYGSDVGVNVYVDSQLRKSKRFDAPGLISKNRRFEQMLKYWTPDLCWTSPEKFDLVLTLGGDGTVLFTSWLFQRIVPPVLSFSLGSLGFLTNFEFSNYKETLSNIMGDAGMRVNLRMRFTCTVFRADRRRECQLGAVEEGEQFEVMNELVIDRGPSPYVSNLELYADDELLTVVQADGCIFSTPTGKYHETAHSFILTGLCPR